MQKKIICARPTSLGERCYSPGDVITIPENQARPQGFLPAGREHYFCLAECTRGGFDYKPGYLWDQLTTSVPEGLFAPLSEKDDYELRGLGNNEKRYFKKPQSEKV